MTHEEIDILWQQAMQESIKDGEMYTRYHFAKLVAEKALAQEKALQALHNENERLGLYKNAYAQPEQEPVAWVNKERNTITWDKLYPDMDALYTNPPQRTEPLIGCVNHDCAKCKEQEPVAWMHIQGNYQESSFRQLDDWEIKNGFKQYPLYRRPPQRTEQEPVIDKSAAIRIATALGWTPPRKENT